MIIWFQHAYNMHRDDEERSMHERILRAVMCVRVSVCVRVYGIEKVLTRARAEDMCVCVCYTL